MSVIVVLAEWLIPINDSNCIHRDDGTISLLMAKLLTRCRVSSPHCASVDLRRTSMTDLAGSSIRTDHGALQLGSYEELSLSSVSSSRH